MNMWLSVNFWNLKFLEIFVGVGRIHKWPIDSTVFLNLTIWRARNKFPRGMQEKEHTHPSARVFKSRWEKLVIMNSVIISTSFAFMKNLWLQLNESLRHIFRLLTGPSIKHVYMDLVHQFVCIRDHTHRMYKLVRARVCMCRKSIHINNKCRYLVIVTIEYNSLVHMMCLHAVVVELEFDTSEPWWTHAISSSNRPRPIYNYILHTQTQHKNQKDRKFCEHKIIYGCAIKLSCIQL